MIEVKMLIQGELEAIFKPRRIVGLRTMKIWNVYLRRQLMKFFKAI